jgi:hypothetical protein
VFTDSDQGHGWNEAAVHRQLEVLKAFFGNCEGGAPVGGHNPAPSLVTNGSAAHGRPALRETVTIPMSTA